MLDYKIDFIFSEGFIDITIAILLFQFDNFELDFTIICLKHSTLAHTHPFKFILNKI